MDSNYFSAASIAHAALRAWLLPPPTSSSSTPTAPSPGKKEETRHIIFTSSVVAFYPIAGYAPYSPGKTALRALSDTLAQELHLYPIAIKPHALFPATISSPGLAAENALKHAVTTILEDGDAGQTPDQAARACIRGLERGRDGEIVTTGWLGWALAVAMLGASKRGLLDVLGAALVAGVMPFVRWDMDAKVRKWGRENRWGRERGREMEMERGSEREMEREREG